MDDDSPTDADHDPTDATAEQVADYCGIGLDMVPDDRVPVEQYRQTGTVACDECGAEPDPPTRAVAVFGGEVLCHECAAADLADGLEPAAARALVLHHFGWGVEDLEEEPTIAAHEVDAEDLLMQARLEMG